MVGDENRRCAVCNNEEVFSTPTLPPGWEQYLRETNGWVPVTSVYVPLCHSCYPVYDRLKSGGYSPESTDTDRVQEILDKISVSELIESEWGPNA